MAGNHKINNNIFNRIISNWSEIPADFRREYKVKKNIKSPRKAIDKIAELKTKNIDSFDERLIGLLCPILRSYLCYDEYFIIDCTLEQQERIIGYIENSEPEHRQYVIPCYDGPVLIWETFARNGDFQAMNEYVSSFFKNITCEFKPEALEADLSVIPDKIDEYLLPVWNKEEDTSEYIKWRTEFEKTVAHIMYPTSFLIKTEYGNRLISKNDLFTNYGEDYEFVKTWLADPLREKFDHMEFLPKMDCPINVKNTFTGFKIPETDEVGTTEKFEELLDLVSNHDEATKEYIKQWSAHIFQKPGEMPRTALVFRGRIGTGKNTYTEILKRLLTSSLYFETSDPINDLFCRFSTRKEDKLLIVLNETESKQTFQNNQKIKDMITNTIMNIESKGIKAYEKNSFIRLLFHTNTEIPLKIEIGDRRFMVSQTSTKRKGDGQYWKEFYAWMNKPENIKAVYTYLMKVKITLDFENDRPKTDAYYDIQESCLPSEIKWLNNLIIDNFPKEYLRESGVSHNELFENYRSTLPKGFEATSIKFGSMMKKLEVEGFEKIRSNFGMKWKIDRDTAFEWLKKNNYTRETELPSEVEIEFIEEDR